MTNKRGFRLSGQRLLPVALACLLAAGCTGTALYSKLSEQQANEVMAALLSQGISAEKAPTSNAAEWEVRVGRGDIPQAMQILTSRGLPRAPYVSMCEIFKKEGFASSAIEEKARYQCSLQQEIAYTLSQIPGVVEARVHIALPERDPLGNETADSSAAVTIFEQPGANVRDRETDIKVTVKDSVEGLSDVNKVTVKFYTVGSVQAQVARQGGVGAKTTLSALSPATIAIAASAVIVLGLSIGLFGRLRGGGRGRMLATDAARPQPNGRIWNG